MAVRRQMPWRARCLRWKGHGCSFGNCPDIQGGMPVWRRRHGENAPGAGERSLGAAIKPLSCRLNFCHAPDRMGSTATLPLGWRWAGGGRCDRAVANGTAKCLQKLAKWPNSRQTTNPLESGRRIVWRHSDGSITCYGIAEMPPVRLCTALISFLMIIGCAGPMGVIHGGTVTAAPVTSFDGSYSNTIRVIQLGRSSRGNYLVQFAGTTDHHGGERPVQLRRAAPQRARRCDHKLYGDHGAGWLVLRAGRRRNHFRASERHPYRGNHRRAGCVYAFAGDRI